MDAGAQGAGTSWRLLEAAILALAFAILAQACLGALGLLRPVPLAFAAALGAGLALALLVRERPGRALGELARSATAAEWILALAVLLALASRAWAGLHLASFSYDALGYHLHMPATWRALGRLTFVPAVFGDPSSAYAPSNMELLFHAWLALVGSDALASTGQTPLAALACLAIHVAVRERGGTRAAGSGAALAFLLVPEVWQQSTSALTDLGQGAFFLSAVAVLLRAERAGTLATWGLAGLALGLMLGTKYLSLVYSLPLFAWAAFALTARPPRGGRAPAAALAGCAVLLAGGFWYARNCWLTGNPLFPLRVEIAGRTVLPGLYGRAEMLAWDYHTPISDLGALGSMLSSCGWAFAAAALVALAVLVRTRWPLLVAIFLALFWLVIPYQLERFLLPVFGLCAIALGEAAFRLGARGGTALIAVAVGGALVERPWPGRLVVLAAVPAGALLAFLRQGLARAAERPRVLAAGALVLGAGGWLAVSRELEQRRGRYPGYAVGTPIDDSWRWIHEHLGAARVAYAGTNLTLPLWGPELERFVTYANVSGAPGAKLHDFSARALPGQGGAEPAPYREGASVETWRANLEALAIDTLFVGRLYPIVARVVDHDPEGFPVERAWADADPEGFELLYANPSARIYRVLSGPRSQR